ncbi:hypothetical protein LCM02_07985 [Lutimonas saemankumensis]|uniref:hypothetical protein n=1 Tax=Lutimonas saemankumensis TaxID=483016 RepID=UPI001CD50785|nr:hypothetical protein [Lutimonas saemankumensis]MCA0932388.1 hypothetical protein [Lutimonas saemankumensis]
MRIINILWTGGWDSTYRVLSLIDKKVTIQPYYLKDNRKSEGLELKAIETITEQIRNHPRTKCNLLKLVTIYVSDIAKDKEITNSYVNILKSDFYGSQYEWLARFAKTVENLELTIHQEDKAFSIIKKYGEIKKTHDELYFRFYVLDKEKSSEDLIKVFGNYRFPILDSSKLKMKLWAESMGLLDIMNMTWFCHHPKNNAPCGVCNPCIYTIEEGLIYRFSKRALRRYRIYKIIRPLKQSYFYRYARMIYKKIR